MIAWYVSMLWFNPGEMVQAGAWGRRVMSIGTSHPWFSIERELEGGRQRQAPDAPSRWNSTFCFVGEDRAVAFAKQRAAGDQDSHYLYVVQISEETPTWRASMRQIDLWGSVHTPQDAETWADTYWVPDQTDEAELIAGGDLTIIHRHAEAIGQRVGSQNPQLSGHIVLTSEGEQYRNAAAAG